MRRPLIAVVFLLASHFSIATAGEVAFDFATVARTGDTVGGQTLTNFSLFHAPAILPNGGTVYTVNTGGGEQAIVAEQELVAVTGSQVPGEAAGTHYNVFANVVVNGLGDVALSALYDGPAVNASNNYGVIEYTGGTVNAIIQKGDVAPDTGGDTYGDLGSLRYNVNHEIGFLSTLQTSGDQTLYYRRGGSTDLVAREGYPILPNHNVLNIAAHTTGGDLDHPLDFLAVFMARTFNPETATESTTLVQNDSDNDNTILVATNDTLPGLPAETTLTDMFVPKMNGEGTIGLFAEFGGVSVGTSVHAIEYDDGDISDGRSVAKTGDTAPGATDFRFSSFSKFELNTVSRALLSAEIVLTESGSGAASGSPRGVETRQGLWYEDATGTLQLAAMSGQDAPGLDPGVTIEQIEFGAINELSQVVFKSKLLGPGVSPFVNDEAVWMVGEDGQLQLVVRKGDLFDVNDDPGVEDLRTINGIAPIAASGGTGGVSTSLNDSGQLALTLNFSDFTSGVFVANLSATTLQADFDNDGDVDGDDFLAWQGGFGLTMGATKNDGDADGDGDVDGDDFLLWQSEFGSGDGANNAVVPEPSGFVLCVLAPILVLLQLRHGVDNRKICI